MRIARGDRVTRTRGAYVHVANVVDARGVVHALCGTAIWRPSRARDALSGPACQTCLTLAKAPGDVRA